MHLTACGGVGNSNYTAVVADALVAVAGRIDAVRIGSAVDDGAVAADRILIAQGGLMTFWPRADKRTAPNQAGCGAFFIPKN